MKKIDNIEEVNDDAIIGIEGKCGYKGAIIVLEYKNLKKCQAMIFDDVNDVNAFNVGNCFNFVEGSKQSLCRQAIRFGLNIFEFNSPKALMEWVFCDDNEG